ncbi:MAG TPA: NAD(P)/FAD-dependent oxidoreductase [Candidatus Nitrosopolaris sp.]|nr:NAD(P)/FAD-dependent oxidoreductase [Candidatus Nitrosopolaris sp.]
MVTYDIAVVGGGPAGLSAAYAAAKAGGKVILLEKDEAIAHSVRTSGVTWIDEIEKLGISSEHYNPIRNYSFISSSNEVTIRGITPKSCVLNVRSTYQHLAMLAAEAGAEIMVRSKVTNVVTTSEDRRICRLKAKTPKGETTIDCRVVIDASGFSSTIARSLGIVKEWRRYGIGAEFECYCENLDHETWVLMVGTKYSEAGYAWIFPVSKNKARIGVGIGRPESCLDPLQKLNDIMDKKLRPLDVLRKIQPMELHYGFIPNEGPRAPIVYDKLILVGDSAGQSNPLVLEGIRYAIEYGRLAGNIGMNQNCSKEGLAEYEKIWKVKHHSKITSALRVQKRWISLSDEEWNREIDILKEMSVDEFVDFIKAEFTIGKLLKFALNHPKLATRQLIGLVTRP